MGNESQISQSSIQELEQFGGYDPKDLEQKPDPQNPNLPYPDKGGHQQRSLVNQPNHSKRKK
jgi:hypothetical protein